ncbi:MAG: pentapeptide repeat-containing protein [Pseudomonadota bacterium]
MKDSDHPETPSPETTTGTTAKATAKATQVTLVHDEDAAALARIERISINARSAWFGLLALLAFVGISLLGHRDADFFLAAKETDLPLVGVTVPVEAFFVTAPLLVGAVYAYLHLSLLTLWDALADAPAEIEGKPLGDRAFPWLLNAWALGVRRAARWREDAEERAALPEAIRDDAPCAEPHPLAWLSAAISVALAWIAGPFILLCAWWISHPAHDFWLAMIAATAFSATTTLGYTSWRAATQRLRGAPRATIAEQPFTRPCLALLAATAVVSYERTWAAPSLFGDLRAEVGPFWTPFLAPADLGEVAFTTRPEDWRPFELWLEDHRKANGTWDETETSLIPTEREMQRYALWLDRLPAAPLKGADLRSATLTRAYLPNADLRESNMQEVDLSSASMQGANLSSASMQGADLVGAHMQGTNLFDASMQGANLGDASMQGTNLRRASMQGTNLGFANMQGAILEGASMQGADVIFANMQEVKLNSASMQGANLFGVYMQGADLRSARMQGADLIDASMQGANLSHASMQGTNLRRASMQGTNLDFANMQGAILEGASIQGANLFSASMQNASCAAAILQGAAAHRATILCHDLGTDALLQTTGDATTRLPVGITVSTCLPGGEHALSDELGDAIKSHHQVAWTVGDVILRHSRETFLDLILCDEGEVPLRFEGVWEPMGDGRWQNYRDGTIHAEGVTEPNEWTGDTWGDIAVPWVIPPNAPPPDGVPMP